jgi:hypothetical protein
MVMIDLVTQRQISMIYNALLIRYNHTALPSSFHQKDIPNRLLISAVILFHVVVPEDTPLVRQMKITSIPSTTKSYLNPSANQNISSVPNIQSDART